MISSASWMKIRKPQEDDLFPRGSSTLPLSSSHNSQNKLASHPISSLSISLTSALLLVGTSTGLIQIYDIPSHQLLRTISTHKGLCISHVATMLKPPDLVGHISLTLNVGSSADARDVIPVKPVAPFQRMRDTKAREAHEVSMILPIQDMVHIRCHINLGDFLMLS